LGIVGDDLMAQRLVQKTLEQAEALKTAAAEAKRLREEREKQFKIEREILNAQYEALKEKDLPTDLDFSGAFKPSLFNNPKLGGLLDEETQRLAQIITIKFLIEL